MKFGKPDLLSKISPINILRGILFIIGIAALINGIVLSFTTNFNLGNILTLLLGTVLLFWSIKYDFVSTFVPKIIRRIIATGLILVFIFASLLLCYGTIDNADNKEDAVIVLGAAVHGEIPSLVLRDRLDAAVEYSAKSPKAIIIVSGGKGPQESITEAEAMEKYLLNKGISADKIIKEDRSTSTYENFLNSKTILEERLGEDYKACFITNEYHVFRAESIAKSAGFESITHTNSSTRWYSVLPGTLREILAVMKFWVFGN